MNFQDTETISAIYARFIAETNYSTLPGEVVRQAKMLVLDLIGVALAGYKMMEFPRLVVAYLADLGGKPEATMIQARGRFPALNAALANAACAHALDMDDGHRFGALHPGVVVIPTALAAAEMSGASTRSFLAGVAVGYEIMIRVGLAINPSSLNRGFHATGVTGVFGAAAAAAGVIALSLEEISGALGLAGLQAAGILQVNHESIGAKVKPINPAKAAQSGLLAVVLARRGAQGPAQIFEGQDGFLRAFSDEVNLDLLTKGLGQEFEIQKTYTKLYAACRHAHAAVDAALELRRRSGLDPDNIKEIQVETYPAAIRLAGITQPTTPSAARFSIPFSVALALVKGDAGADKYCPENIADEAIQALAGRVRLSVSERWRKLYPHKRGAAVKIIDRQAQAWSAEVDLAKGEPENPASHEELQRKFLSNAAMLISEEEARRLGEVIANLDELSLADLTRFL